MGLGERAAADEHQQERDETGCVHGQLPKIGLPWLAAVPKIGLPIVVGKMSSR